MSKSPQAANRITGLYGLPSHSLRVDPRDRRDIGHDGLTRPPRLDGADVMSARLDREDATPWPSSILAFFMDGFALYGASYHASPHVIATSPAGTSAAKASAPQPEANSSRARRRAMAIVSSAMHSGVAQFEDDTNRAVAGSETASEAASFDTDRSNGRSCLWHSLADRWAQWRREREIKKAFAALVEPDRRTSRNFGIPHRDRIEQVTGYRRDC
jgi:hypothetical protein